MRRHILPWLVVAASARAAGPGPWEFVRDDEGILVHRRAVPGSSLGEFRGQAVIEAPVERVIAVLADADRRVEWMNRCVGSRAVERLGPWSQVTYNRTSAPWPLADRDTVVRVDTAFDVAGRRVMIAFRSVAHPGAPPLDDVVRMPDVRGHWILSPENAGAWTRVEYQVFAVPGGSLPDWVTNLISRKVPHRTIVRLREQCARRAYPERETELRAVPEVEAILAEPPATTASAATGI